MAIPSQNKGKRKSDGNCLRFPDVGNFDTIEEYNEAVKGYWNVIDTYRHMAVKFCDEIRKEKACERQET